jgi:hypothetical protein
MLSEQLISVPLLVLSYCMLTGARDNNCITFCCTEYEKSLNNNKIVADHGM